MKKDALYFGLIFSILAFSGCASRNTHEKYIERQKKTAEQQKDESHYKCVIPVNDIKYSSELERRIDNIAKSFNVKKKILKDDDNNVYEIIYSSDRSHMSIVDLYNTTTDSLNQNGN